MLLLAAVMFKYTIGANPADLVFGVINDEIQSYDDCRNISLITTKPQNDGENCDLKMISCRFLLEIEKEKFGKVVIFKEFDDAYKSARKREIASIIRFSSNFTSSTQALLEIKAHKVEDKVEDDLLNDREIAIWMDETEFFLTVYMKAHFYLIYQNYSNDMLRDCKLPTKINLSPIQIQQPIYGSKTLNMTEFVGPITCIMFYMVTFFCVTVTTFIDERKKGLWNRTLLSGVSLTEMIFGHVTINVFLGIIHACTFIPLMFYHYPNTTQVSLSLIITYYAMFGLFGIGMGILGGAIFNDYTAAMAVGCFFAYLLFFFTGKIIFIDFILI